MSSVAIAVKNWEKRQGQSTLLTIKPSAAESKPFFTVYIPSSSNLYVLGGSKNTWI